MTPTDDLAAVVRDEAERCGVDVRDLARVLLGWTAEEMQHVEGWLSVRRRISNMDSLARQTAAMPRRTIGPRLAESLASPPAAPGGDESGQ